MHLILDKYFLAFDPALSSNSLGVSHSSPNWMHFPLLPVSYLFEYRMAVVDLHLTFITAPNFFTPVNLLTSEAPFLSPVIIVELLDADVFMLVLPVLEVDEGLLCT